jgi:hypothetical protein
MRKQPTRAVAFRLVGLLLIVTAAGCGDDSGRMPVRGRVLLDGQELAAGIVSFHPAAGTRSRTTGAAIVDGQFQIGADQGLEPGAYRITIQAFETTGRIVHDPQKGDIPERLPVRLAAEKPLSVRVTAGQANELLLKVRRAGR